MSRVRSRLLLPSLSAAVLLGSAGPAGAQVTVVDEGTFSLFRDGVRAGREDFSIRASAGLGGSAFVAQGNVLLGESRLSVALNADSAGAPLRVQVTLREGQADVGTVSGESRGGIWLGRTVRPDGESAREVRLPPGTVALEQDVVHQLWFAVRGGARALTLLSPRALALREARLEEAGADAVAIGLRELPARRWVLRAADGATLREVWTDAEGRLLRVRDPASGTEALRDEAPAETPAR